MLFRTITVLFISNKCLLCGTHAEIDDSCGGGLGTRLPATPREECLILRLCLTLWLFSGRRNVSGRPLTGF